jgi:hypothetical protein
MATKDHTSRPTTVRNADENASKEDTCIASPLPSQSTSQEGSREPSGRSNIGSSARIQTAEEIRTQLAEHVGALRFVNSAMMVCVQALLQQAADLDEEIALVLQRTVSDKLDETIERIEAIALGIEFEGRDV